MLSLRTLALFSIVLLTILYGCSDSRPATNTPDSATQTQQVDTAPHEQQHEKDNIPVSTQTAKAPPASPLLTAEPMQLERRTAEQITMLKTQHAKVLAMALQDHADTIAQKEVIHEQTLLTLKENQKDSLATLSKELQEQHTQELAKQQQQHDDALRLLHETIKERDHSIKLLTTEITTYKANAVIQKELAEKEKAAVQAQAALTAAAPAPTPQRYPTGWTPSPRLQEYIDALEKENATLRDKVTGTGRGAYSKGPQSISGTNTVLERLHNTKKALQAAQEDLAQLDALKKSIEADAEKNALIMEGFQSKADRLDKAENKWYAIKDYNNTLLAQNEQLAKEKDRALEDALRFEKDYYQLIGIFLKLQASDTKGVKDMQNNLKDEVLSIKNRSKKASIIQ